MPRSDSDGSLYEPDGTPPAPLRPFSSLDPTTTTNPPSRAGSSALPTGANTSQAPTPLGSDTGDNDGDGDGDDSARGTAGGGTTAEQTPDPQPQPQQPAKRSRALNFLKKKEPKTSITIKGVTYQIRDDEILLPDDPRGEAKIDHLGNLLGDRQWKVHTFTSPLRQNPNRVYILSIDAARAAGFRDSLYFFRRNPMIHKLTCNQEEKDRLIELGRLSGNLKSRAVTMVAARNVFKVMGATFLQGGKYVVDDYYEDKSIAAGHKPGEPAFIEAYDPDKDTGTLATSKGNAPPGATSLGLNHLIGHPGKPKVPGAELLPVGGAPGGYTATFGGTGMQPFGRAWDPMAKKAKPAAHLTWSNWMLEYAQSVRDENSRLAGVRRGNVGQVQVGLGVEEDEDDCWEWVEEEYDDDEGVDQAAAPAPAEEVKPSLDAAPPAHGLGGFSNGLPSLPPPLDAAAGSPHPHAAAAAAPAPSPAAPLDPSLASPFPLPSTSASSPYPGSPFPPSTSTSSAPAAPAPAAEPAPPARPKKRRLVRVYTPIRGVYDPETNVPHVYRATQPRRVVDFAQVEKRPRLVEGEGGAGAAAAGEGSGMELDGEAEAQSDRRREAARRAGLASVEVVSDPRAWALEVEGAGAGATAVEAALASRAGREDLVPGTWDFLELARSEGLVA
ncbi:hypothetical protein JCM9279_007238 [Rhodotorula babjevae]